MNNLRDHIAQKLDEYHNQSIYVAVSGGLDSMVLLHITQQLGYTPTALHVNYHLRGEESNQDQKFIENYCTSHQIPFLINEVELADILKTEGGNLQQTAREYRYNWFREILDKDEKAVILLAHHRDDQIETFFLQAFRGAGILGLSAMPFKKDNYLRPLLNISREEILDYAQKEKIDWREDSSNASLKYNRNKLRHEFIPYMEIKIPTLKADVSLLISLFQENYSAIQNKVLPIVSKVNDSGSMSVDLIRSLNDEELNELLRQLKIPIQMRGEVKKLADAENNKRIRLEGTLFQLVKSDDVLRLVESKGKFDSAVLKIETLKDLPESFGKNEIYLDADKVQGELTLRNWKEGDRIYPIGLSGSQLISKVLHDQKVLPELRQHIQVLCDEKDILWCPGHKVGRTALATQNSKRILKCSITYKES